MLTPKRFVHITLAALFAFNSLWARAEITLIGQGELPGDTKGESKLSRLLEDSVPPHDRAGGLSSGIPFSDRGVFQRIATFPVFLNTDEGTETAAEIVSVSEDGRLLIYTDSPTGNLGFVDIADPREPKPSGVLKMFGEPTSVAVAGPYALAAVNTSQSFSAPSGKLAVVDMVDIGEPSIVHSIELGGQPDSIAVSPDKRYAVIAIENERGTPIPWGALSALAADRWDPHTLYTAYDSFYRQSRIFSLDIGKKPAVITDELVLHRNGETVDLDLEGIAQRRDGGFWAVSEGAGSVDDPERPVTSVNLLLKIAPDGAMVDEIPLPDSVNGLQRRFGLEGVASVGSGDEELVYVAFQREWVNDPDHHVRIGRYETATGDWTFFYYPIEQPTSPNGGWVGLSELVALGKDAFAVVERDNQAGTNARIKRIYKFSIAGLDPQPQGGVFPLVQKHPVRDLMPDLEGPNGSVIEKVDGLAVNRNGRAFIVTDNDGVADSSGETLFLRLGKID